MSDHNDKVATGAFTGSESITTNFKSSIEVIDLERGAFCAHHSSAGATENSDSKYILQKVVAASSGVSCPMSSEDTASIRSKKSNASLNTLDESPLMSGKETQQVSDESDNETASSSRTSMDINYTLRQE
ncbi:hypothetical protein BGZ65_004601 [Modicella reniformis]|uniref:Uncharacterized protein n=1 Tax=Modicella reniformis TaxID=1440133 RepID=A0A9P6MBF5_9FUNG|nr:hypothetical protein BGZ65_004601 [Modicella reniformis]